MKVAFVADVHLANHRRFGGEFSAGINGRCAAILRTFRSAVHLAVEEGAELFVVAGDLFDSSKPEPQIIAALMAILREYKSRIDFILLRGNHEQHSTDFGDNSLHVLMDHARIVELPEAVKFPGVELILVPFAPVHAPAHLLAALKSIDPRQVDRRYLVGHFGVSDKDTPPWLRGAQDSIDIDTLTDMLDDYAISAAFVGNWHKREDWLRLEAHVHQLGALVPNGWKDQGLAYGNVAILDTDRGETRFGYVGGPRFIVGSLPEIEATLDAGRGVDTIYAQVTVEPEQAASTLKKLNELRRKYSYLAAVDVVIDRAEARVAARAAATLARSSETLVQALDEFVKAMPIESEEVDRDRVRDLSRDYLAKGKQARP